MDSFYGQVSNDYVSRSRRANFQNETMHHIDTFGGHAGERSVADNNVQTYEIIVRENS
jgi:hypothetical protein